MCVCVCVCVCVRVCVRVLVAQSCPILCDPMDCSPLGFSVHEIPRQEYWSGLLFPSPEEIPNPGIEPWSPASQADSLQFELQGSLSTNMSPYKNFPAWV